MATPLSSGDDGVHHLQLVVVDGELGPVQEGRRPLSLVMGFSSAAFLTSLDLSPAAGGSPTASSVVSPAFSSTVRMVGSTT